MRAPGSLGLVRLAGATRSMSSLKMERSILPPETFNSCGCITTWRSLRFGQSRIACSSTSGRDEALAFAAPDAGEPDISI